MVKGKFKDISIKNSEHLIEPAKATDSLIAPLSVCADVSNELISETDPSIFLKFGMQLGDNKVKK